MAVPAPRGAAEHVLAVRGRTTTRLTPRGRRSLVLLAAVAVVLAFWSGRASGTTGAWPDHHPSASVVVRPGDTLWSIARSTAPARDPRSTVDELRRLNHLDGVGIVPGQQLVLRR